MPTKKVTIMISGSGCTCDITEDLHNLITVLESGQLNHDQVINGATLQTIIYVEDKLLRGNPTEY